jgi:DNA repair protein RadC
MIGGISVTVIDPKTVYQAALKANACSIILAHNHPSGNQTPSDADMEITRKCKDSGNILGITILDHLILLTDGYLSMADKGIL